MENVAYQLSKRLVLGEVLARHARKTPEKTALVFGEKKFTFRQFNARVNQLSHVFISHGVKPGDKVSFILYNGNEILECYFAAFKTGAAAVPLNYRLAAPEIQYSVANSQARVLVYDEELEATLNDVDWSKTSVGEKVCVGKAGEYEKWLDQGSPDEPLVLLEEEDPAVIMYTAGTTGKPKGPVLTHKNLFVNATNWILCTQITEKDCWFSPPPLFHAAAFAGMLPHLLVGAKNVVARNYKPEEAVVLIEKEKITGLVLIPTMWVDFLQLKELDDHDTSSLSRCFSGGAIVPLEIKKQIISRWGKMYDSFGQTEMSPNTTMLLPEDVIRKMTSVGKAMPNVELRVVDDQDKDVPVGKVGEVVYRGPTSMLEYYRKPEATAEAFKGGWFHSGDLVRMDEEGFVYVVGRKKDMIISGGENIYPAEIEDVLYEDPRILEAAVIGLPDPKWGENVTAIIVLKAGMTMTEGDVVEVCRKKLAGYKKPKHVYFVDSLLKNATGKIVKNQIRDRFVKELGLKEVE
jgi:acyl-CoA synthetase (AMP-forming)/AMP-acid ligase II